MRCTWIIEIKKKKSDGEIIPAHKCGNVAVATYSRLNPERRHPDEPRQLIHPRCSIHDTPAAQREAPQQGYVREEL